MSHNLLPSARMPLKGERLKNIRLLFMVLSAGLMLQGALAGADLSIGSYSATAGQSVTASVSYAAQGSSVAALQFDLSYNPAAISISAASVAVGPASTSAGKSITAVLLPNGNIRVLLFGLNQNVLQDGIVVTFVVQILGAACPGQYAIAMVNSIAADPAAENAPITTNPGNVSVSSSATESVPNVIGLSQAGALSALLNSCLIAGSVSTLTSGTVAAGNVISQNPAPATQVNAGSAVDLVISSGPSIGAKGPLRFIPVLPCRLVDTRNANGPFGGPKLGGGTSSSFVIPNSPCNIPPTAAAYSLNVTVVPDGQLGYLTIWPTGGAQPLVSTLNSDGRVKANAAIVPAGDRGAVSVFATDPTHLILDIDGYFAPAPSPALDFYPVTPCRIADTRQGSGFSGQLGPPFLSGGAAGRSFPILSSACNIPSNAQAYSLNLTAVPHGPLGFISVWPAGQPQPLVSTLNAPTGVVTANASLVPAGEGGAISVFAANDTDLVIDVNGYFAPPASGGLSFYAVTPCRVLDTRNPPGSPPFNGMIVTNVAGSNCLPQGSGAQVFVLNATVVPPGPLGFLTLWPDAQGQPLVSTLNAPDGAITSNLAILPAVAGSIDAFASDPAQLVLDISGYFAP